MTLPVLAITTGDPAGIGPEICVRAALHPEVQSRCRPVLIGDEAPIADAVRRFLGGTTASLRVWRRAELAAGLAAPATPGAIELLSVGALAAPVAPGIATAEGGMASYRYIVASIEESQAGRFAGVVTAPINKHALHLAGVDFPGHTEIFGEATKASPYAMMMYSERLAVGLVTCHQSLASVPGALTIGRVAEVGRLLSRAVERIRGRKPRMAVLGLNPHAGEEGLFGWEERDVVRPAMELLAAEGFDVEGPLPPDTAFTQRALRDFGAHLCLYHDQGLIPFKMLCFEEGVNVTMGLPFVRTSVDHGTAYDIAGKGVADIGSLISAVALAAKLSQV